MGQKIFRKEWWQKISARVGPGVVTGAADDDPSGIATYAQAGAGFGYSTLWLPVFATPLMAGVQEMCARIGIVTRHGLAGTMRRFYSAWLLYPVALAVFAANTINIGADLAAVGAALKLVVPKAPEAVTVAVFAAGVMAVVIWSSYRTIARVFKWLTLSLLFYMLAAAAARPDWGLALRQTIWPQLVFDRGFFLVIVAMLGTTISPYLFFWQASTEAEEKMLNKGPYGWFKRFLVSRKEMTAMRQDVGAGMVVSNLAMYFVTMAAAGTLFRQGLAITTAADVAAALAPIAGDWAGWVFAAGIIGTGALAIPVLAGSAAYAGSEALGWRTGLNMAFGKAKAFYSVMAISTLLGLGLTWLGLDAVKMLFWTAVMYGLMSPPLIAVVLHVANNRKVMGKWVNGRRENVLGVATLVVMTLAAVGLIF